MGGGEVEKKYGQKLWVFEESFWLYLAYIRLLYMYNNIAGGQWLFCMARDLLCLMCKWTASMRGSSALAVTTPSRYSLPRKQWCVSMWRFGCGYARDVLWGIEWSELEVSDADCDVFFASSGVASKSVSNIWKKYFYAFYTTLVHVGFFCWGGKIACSSLKHPMVQIWRGVQCVFSPCIFISLIIFYFYVIDFNAI